MHLLEAVKVGGGAAVYSDAVREAYEAEAPAGAHQLGLVSKTVKELLSSLRAEYEEMIIKRPSCIQKKS